MDWTWGPTPTQAEEPEGKSEEETAQINTRISDLLPPYMYKNKHLVNRLSIYEQRKQHELTQLRESVEYQFIAQVAAFTNENLDQYWQENFNSMIDNNTQTERMITDSDIDNARREAHVLADADVHRWCIYARALNVGVDDEANMQDPDKHWVTLIAERTQERVTIAINTAVGGNQPAVRALGAIDRDWDAAVASAAEAQNDARIIGVQTSLDAATRALEAIHHANIDNAAVAQARLAAEDAQKKAEVAAWGVAENMANNLVSAVHIAGTKVGQNLIAAAARTLTAVKSARKQVRSHAICVAAANAALRALGDFFPGGVAPAVAGALFPNTNRQLFPETPRGGDITASAERIRQAEVQAEQDAQSFKVHRFQDVRNATRLQYFLTRIGAVSKAALVPHLNKLSHDGIGWHRDMSHLRLVLNAHQTQDAAPAVVVAETEEEVQARETEAAAAEVAAAMGPTLAVPTPAVALALANETNYLYNADPDPAVPLPAPPPVPAPADAPADAETYLDAARLHTYIPEVRSYYAQRCHHWFHQIIKSNYDSRPLLAADKWYNKTTWARLHHYYAPVLYGHMREIASVLKNTHPQLNLRDAKMKEALPWLIGKNGDAGSDQRSFLFAKCVALAIRGSQVLSGKRYGLNSTFVRIKSLRRLAMHAWKKVKQGYKA
jgi:hypothetical protein